MSTQHHGQYKVLGGKLVRVDLTVEDGDVTAASLNGDFFLEPDEALEDINGALVGLAEDTEHAVTAQRVQAAIRPGAQLFGFDADAVATAVRRALGRATAWEDHEWEVIAPTPLPIHQHVALDQILTEDVAAGRRKPLMRLWQWTEPAVVIGAFQSLANEVDAEGAAAHDIHVMRRISGGGAMFMEADNCVTYSLSLPRSLVDGMSTEESYPFLDDWTMEALSRVGVEAFYQPLNDIATPQGKIGGAAQKKVGTHGLLHHVTMSYDIDADKMTQVLRIGREKLKGKGVASAKKRVDPLRRQTGNMTRPEIWEVMMQVFEERYGAKRVELDQKTLDRAQALAEEKFLTQTWLQRVP
ncbi:lipoate--protein ligase [Micrococcus sp. HMSC067E09]|uniref:lipoate--protein ligase family protein n=1 Tax=Micrococcus sp. HMSC067E09 TaxID=1739367 RepID=UPI0008A4D690|nr:biotin/lipoate A/B protein ligase family protein [Micrococcus sp. HMSC067E09]OFR86217.1 lipoate--protein ligase [Micrococcus sp. HMSC067E09]